MDFQDLREMMSNSLHISKRHLNEMYDSTRKLIQRSRSRESAIKEVQEREINQFLYTPEDLSVLGKEYWFFLFTGTGSNFRDQLMASFGRNNNNSMKINNVAQLKDTPYYYGGIGETWFFIDNNTTQFGKLGGKIVRTDDSIRFETDEYQIKLSGMYPNYNLEITQNGNFVAELQTDMPLVGDSLEFFSIEKANLGVEIGNVYLDYTGNLNNLPFQGRCYMQKVVMSAPFIPWYWGRFIFENGSVFIFFLLWVDFPGVSRTIYSQAKFYDPKEEKYHVVSDFSVKNVGGTDYWLITHNSSNKNLFVLLEVYTNNVFEMQARGEFRYNETFAVVKEIRIQLEGRVFDNLWFGKGSGSLEQATGIAF